jgi:hypothetical protein
MFFIWNLMTHIDVVYVYCVFMLKFEKLFEKFQAIF